MSNFISVLYMALHISIMGVCYLNNGFIVFHHLLSLFHVTIIIKTTTTNSPPFFFLVYVIYVGDWNLWKLIVRIDNKPKIDFLHPSIHPSQLKNSRQRKGRGSFTLPPSRQFLSFPPMVDVIWSLEKVDRICHQSNGFRRFGKKCHLLYTGDAVMLFVMFCLHFVASLHIIVSYHLNLNVFIWENGSRDVQLTSS